MSDERCVVDDMGNREGDNARSEAGRSKIGRSRIDRPQAAEFQSFDDDWSGKLRSGSQ